MSSLRAQRSNLVRSVPMTFEIASSPYGLLAMSDALINVMNFGSGTLVSPLPDITSQENRRGSASHARKAAGAEAQDPRREPRRPTKFIERSTEEDRPEEPSGKADAR